MPDALVFLTGALTGALVAGAAMRARLAIRGDLAAYERARADEVGVVAPVVDGLALAELGHGFAVTRRVQAMAAEYRDRVGDMLDLLAEQRDRIAELEQLRPYAGFVYGAARAAGAPAALAVAA